MGRPLNIHKFGGDLAKLGKQLKVVVKLDTGAAADAELIQQKNQYSFRVALVSDLTKTGICRFVDKVKTALLPGEMILQVTLLDGTKFKAKKITNRFVWDFEGNRYLWTATGTATAAVPATPTEPAKPAVVAPANEDTPIADIDPVAP